MRTMDRVVTTYLAVPSGELRAESGAPWRVERAVGESELHRTLAALDPTPESIARAASNSGPLRLGGDVVGVIPDGAWDEIGTVLGQTAVPGWLGVTDWIKRGCEGPIPTVLAGAMPLIRAFATLPPPVEQYVELLGGGASTPAERATVVTAIAEGAAGFQADRVMTDLVNAVAEVGQRIAAEGQGSLGEAQPVGPTPCDDEAIARGVRMMMWAQEALAGRVDGPPGVDASGLVGYAVAALPDLLAPVETFLGNDEFLSRLVAHLRTETLDGWLSTCGQMGAWVTAIEIRKREDAGALLASDRERLRSLIPMLLDGIADGTENADTAGELAALLMPRLVARLRGLLQQFGAWPYPADRLVGAYGRALWAVWAELTDERPPQRCAASGCPETFPAHGNRRYCDAHLLIRDRDRKRIAAGQARGD